MNKTILNSLTPHLVAILLFIVLSFSYFTSVLEGKKLIAHDTQSWVCDAKETLDYNDTHDDVTLCTIALFGGMPNYQISMSQPNNVLQYVENLVLGFPRQV